MSFVTDEVVKDAVVKGGLHKLVAGVSADVWNQAVADGNAAAYAQIRQRLRSLGYSQAQIDSWSDGAAYQKSLAIYEALIRAAGPGQEGGEWRTELDYWRTAVKELETIDVAGDLPDAEDVPDAVGHGSLSTTNDLFVLDPNDRRRGATTEW